MVENWSYVNSFLLVMTYKIASWSFVQFKWNIMCVCVCVYSC